ncbi:MAG: hypothetical protein DWP97_07365 [Calditrichaeota bacterium]|nr:MAG: hypothetical protein DWP97_07365 [Calditrichota bacterium]
MSTRIKVIWVVLVFVILSVALGYAESDEVIDFYTTRAEQVYQSRSPFESGIQFSFKAHTYFKIFNGDQNAIVTDSAETVYYFNYGEIDSTKVVYSFKREEQAIEFSYPNIFTDDYVYNFYPHDTGGGDLSIGFDSKDFEIGVPIGIAVIDRDRYFLKWLYMHFLFDKRADRFSRSYRFTEVEGFVFPDSIWESRARKTFFASEYYRIETGISDIKIYR